jgi:hypothetical protein
MSSFPTAAEARAGSRNNLAIHAEIRFLEAKIYTAIEAGLLEVNVIDSPMTDPLVETSADYYSAVFGPSGDRSLKEQVEFVKSNFLDLGYQVYALENSATGDSLKWRIMW